MEEAQTITPVKDVQTGAGPFQIPIMQIYDQNLTQVITPVKSPATVGPFTVTIERVWE